MSAAAARTRTACAGAHDLTARRKYTGSAVIDVSSGTITLYATKVEEITNTCGQPKTTDKPSKQLSWTFEPAPDGDGIWVSDSACSAMYAGHQASINAYCLWTYRKRP